MSRPKPKPLDGMSHLYVCDKHLDRFTDEESKSLGYEISEPDDEVVVINTFIEKCITYDENVTKKYDACMHPDGRITRLHRYGDPVEYGESAEWIECHYCGFETDDSEEMTDHIKRHIQNDSDWVDF